ncbi:hypothetical protein PENSPDRAFT_759388 [Peniophora sp. CONT]|nr:hypothetical protein PENSPDRAFT_759388 [Peniophora sp. CONT]
MSDNEFQETKTLTFEWRLRDLKSVFEASKGEQKSRVTKSAMFGNGTWQILFYANAGTGTPADSGHISLFLSCEPTDEEKEASAALNGRWVRKGTFRFTFEIHDIHKKELFNVKEAQNHSFSYKTANWGWAQFARRDHLSHKPGIRAHDALIITCTITGSPERPTPPPAVPRLPVPKDLLDSFGALLDDPVYSDVEFVLPRRNGSLRASKRIFAMKKILKRYDYFDTMFGSGFQEASTDRFDFFPDQDGANDRDSMSDNISEVTSLGGRGDDSDEEDEESEDEDARTDLGIDSSVPPTTESSDDEGVRTPLIEHSDVQSDDPPMIVRTKVAEPPTPQSSRIAPTRGRTGRPASVQHIQPPRMRVVVRDVAYSTYKAVLYYLYTDIIHFAPLSSTFYATRGPAPAPVQAANESHVTLVGGISGKTGQSAADTFSGQMPSSGSRKEWIREWAQVNPGRPLACSAKAVYRLADKLGLRELRERAFEHIRAGLTVENVPYEVFSTFSATYEAVRKVEVKFFLDHWTSIRASEAMRNVWQQIRVGRHPGFEEVWPVIATNLEFNPQSTTSTTDKTTD